MRITVAGVLRVRYDRGAMVAIGRGRARGGNGGRKGAREGIGPSTKELISQNLVGAMSRCDSRDRADQRNSAN
jgi:hypothetical protein